MSLVCKMGTRDELPEYLRFSIETFLSPYISQLQAKALMNGMERKKHFSLG